jgi:hypothetical protein
VIQGELAHTTDYEDNSGSNGEEITTEAFFYFSQRFRRRKWDWGGDEGNLGRR